jgi:Rod binding domain-containing protein
MAELTAPAAVAASLSPETPRPTPREPTDAARTAARTAAQEFEAFFLAQVLDQMFAGIATDGRFGGGSAEGVYRDLLNQEYGKVLSRSGGLGVADAVYAEILKLQEVE